MNIKPETVAHIVFKARQFEGMVNSLESDHGDETHLEEDVLEELEDRDTYEEEYEHDPTYQDLKAFIDDLDEDDQIELIALAWLGRGDDTADSWDDLVALARERRTSRTGEYLLGMPLLPVYLESGLDEFDISIEDFEDEHER